MSEFNIELLPVKITYVAQVRKDRWDCDQWRVDISYKNNKGQGYWSTDYFTGLGLRAKSKHHLGAPRPTKPTIANILYCLFSDATAANENFNEWCDNYGYSNDSLAALNTYRQCLETAAHLHQAFDKDTTQAIRAIIEDM